MFLVLSKYIVAYFNLSSEYFCNVIVLFAAGAHTLRALDAGAARQVLRAVQRRVQRRAALYGRAGQGTAPCPLPTTQCPLPTSHYPLSPDVYRLSTAVFPLPIAHYCLPITHCRLHI